MFPIPPDTLWGETADTYTIDTVAAPLLNTVLHIEMLLVVILMLQLVWFGAWVTVQVVRK